MSESGSSHQPGKEQSVDSPDSNLSWNGSRFATFEGFPDSYSSSNTKLSAFRLSLLQAAIGKIEENSTGSYVFINLVISRRLPSYESTIASSLTSVGLHRSGNTSDLGRLLSRRPRVVVGGRQDEISSSLKEVLPDFLIWSDTSDERQGAHFQGEFTSGLWSPVEKSNSINWRELRAVHLRLQHFQDPLVGHHIAVFCDNVTAVVYLVKQGDSLFAHRRGMGTIEMGRGQLRSYSTHSLFQG